MLDHTDEEALMKRIKELLAEAFELGFHCANKGLKSAFFHFMKMALVEIVHQRTLKFILTKSLDRLPQSDALVSVLIVKIGAKLLHAQVPPIKDLKHGNLQHLLRLFVKKQVPLRRSMDTDIAPKITRAMGSMSFIP